MDDADLEERMSYIDSRMVTLAEVAKSIREECRSIGEEKGDDYKGKMRLTFEGRGSIAASINDRGDFHVNYTDANGRTCSFTYCAET